MVCHFRPAQFSGKTSAWPLFLPLGMSRGLLLLSRHPVHVIEDIPFAVVKQTNPPIKLVESLAVLRV